MLFRSVLANALALETKSAGYIKAPRRSAYAEDVLARGGPDGVLGFVEAEAARQDVQRLVSGSVIDRHSGLRVKNEGGVIGELPHASDQGEAAR